MRNPVFALALLFTFGAFAASPVEIEFATPLPAGWQITRQNPRGSERETRDDLAFISSADGRNYITLQISKLSAREKASNFEANADAWKQSALKEAGNAGMALSNVKFDIGSHRTGKQASLSLNAMKSERTMNIASRFWIEDDLVVRVAAMHQSPDANPAALKIMDSIRIRKSPSSGETK